MKEQTTVKIFVSGEALEVSITKSTTCDDVITMVSKNITPSRQTKCLAVFESAFGVQKMLSGNTKLLKQIRSWGANENNFNLEIREVDKVKSKMASISRAKTTFQRLRSLITKHEMKSGQKFETYIHDNILANVSDKDKKCYDKNITVLDRIAENELPKGNSKKELLKRYLNDSLELSSLNDAFCTEVDLPERERGVGREKSSFDVSHLPDRTSGDGNENTSDDQILVEENLLNKGFLTRSNDTNSKTFVVKDYLNECVIYDDDEAAYCDVEEDSDYESAGELDRNIIDTCSFDDLKKLFSNIDLNERITEDDLLESFMNTHVIDDDDDSDDGISSVESEFD